MKRHTALWILAACTAACASPGCDALGYMGYLLAPSAGAKKVKAEYEGLAGRCVAIVIYADQGVQYEYPYVRLGLSALLRAELKKHVKDVRVVDPLRVIKYQDQNIHWDAMPRSKLAKAFGADALLYVVLEEYTMREPGSVNLFRGRISAQASVYKAAAPDVDVRAWPGGDFRVVYPEHTPVGELGRDDSRIRYETEKRFAKLLVRKFYKHEVAEEP